MDWMEFIHPAASQALCRQPKRASARAFTRPAAFRLLTIAMALPLSSVSGTSLHLRSATLGPVAQRHVSSSYSAVDSVASTSGRLHRKEACLASSASYQIFGSSELVSWKSSSFASRKQARRVRVVRIRCDQTTEGGNRRSLDTWIGRFAMLGFAAAIGVEVSTGKGVLASAGLPLPVPTPVFGLIALAGAVTAFGVFRSSDRD